MAEVGRRLVQVGGNRVEIEEFDVPEPGPGEVLVRVTRSQISAGSERSGFRDDVPADARRHLGYTTVGRVQAVGEGVEEFAVGDRVLAWGPHGSHWLAARGPDFDGTMPVHHVEYDLTDEQAAFARLGDVALHGVRRAEAAAGRDGGRVRRGRRRPARDRPVPHIGGLPGHWRRPR